METTDLTNEQPATPSKYEGLGSAMTAELMIGFWFGIEVILAIRMVKSLDYCIEEVINLRRRLAYFLRKLGLLNFLERSRDSESYGCG